MNQHDFSVRIRLRAAGDGLVRVRSVVRSVLCTAGGGAFTGEDVEDVLLGLQEALSNVARHAYPTGEAPLVELCAWTRNGRFYASLRDRGRPFIDGERAPVARPAEHGYGLLLLDRTMDQVRRRRRGRKNVLLLVRNGHRLRRGGAFDQD